MRGGEGWGGVGWGGDETPRREVPPRRAAWARPGRQPIGGISGRNAPRVGHGALTLATGERVARGRERRRQDDGAAVVEALGPVRPEVPKRLVWDTAPPHHPKRVPAMAEPAPIRLAFVPLRSPERMPCADRWRLAKAVVAANRPSAAVQEQAERALAWLTALTPFERLLKSGLFGAKFQWLST